jgi:hypothetical protein
MNLARCENFELCKDDQIPISLSLITPKEKVVYHQENILILVKEKKKISLAKTY